MATDTLQEARAALAPELAPPPPDPGAALVAEPRFPGSSLTEEELDVAMYERLQKAKEPSTIPAISANGFTATAEQLAEFNLAAEKKVLADYKARRLARGEQPFQYLPQAKAKQENAAFREQLPFFGTMFSGPEKFAEAFPADQRQAVEDRFADSFQPAAEKMATANKLFFETMTGQEVDDELWPAQRSAFARQRLGYEGASRMVAGGDPSIATAVVDDATFYKLAGAKLTEQQEEVDTTQKVAGITRAHAIRGQSLGDAIAAAKQAAGPHWKKYEAAAREGYAGVLADFDNRTITSANQLFDFAKKAEGFQASELAFEEGQALAMAAYGMADQATRDQMMAIIGTRAEEEGTTVENYFARLAAGVGGGTGNFARQLASGSTRREAEDIRTLLKGGKLPATGTAERSAGGILTQLAQFPEDDKFNATETRPLTPEERKEWEARATMLEGYAAFLTDTETAGIKVRRYIDNKREGFWDTLADTTVMMAESLPVMAAAMVPYGGGILAAGSAYAERNLSTLRREAPDADPDTLKATAYTSGLIEAGIDRLQILTLGARMPKLNAALLKYGKPGLAGVIGVQSVVKGGAEFAQEIAQDLTLPQVQSFASALAEDIPGPDWESVLEREAAALGDIARVSLGFGLIGGAGSSITNYIEAGKIRETLQDRAGLELAGIDPVTVTEIADLAETNPAAAAETLKAAIIETPVETRAANSQAAVQRMEAEALMTTGNEDAGLPVLRKLDDGRVEIAYPDRAAEIVPGPEEALEAVRGWEAEAATTITQQNREMIDYLEGYHRSSPETAFKGEQTGKRVSLADWAGESRERVAQAQARVQIMLRQAGQDMGGVDLSQIPILGSSRNQQARGITSIVAKINDGGNPLTVIEEHAEGVAKWLMDSAKVPEAKMIGWLRETEQKLGKPLLSDKLLELDPAARQQEIVEAWSYLAQANAAGRVADSALPRGVKAFFRAFKEFIHAALSIIADLARLRGQGQLDPELTYWLDVAAGINEEFETENLNREMEAELEREAMDGMPEIRDTLAGRLPHPDTPNLQFRGELRAIYDGMKNDPANGANQAARTRKANEFFLPFGEVADLDQVREMANEKGFDFATPGDMLEALDLSVNFGKPQYGLSAGMDTEQSFSLGRATVTPTASTRVFQGAEGSPTVIGPASFSIRAHHGTPHKVDKFTTAKIGTGEGAQAYGWGLYFAQDEAIARYYRDTLTPSSDPFTKSAAWWLGNASGNYEQAIADLEAQIATLEPGRHVEAKRQALEILKKRDLPKSNLYTVTLKVEYDQLLDWDKPLSEQPEVVRDAVAAYYAKKFQVPLEELRTDLANSEETGRLIYEILQESVGPPVASRALYDVGIRGIRYLDGNSRGSGEGSYNYVIFDDADIEILEENGQPVSLESFGITLPTDPLLAAIAARIQAPEKNAEVFQKMRDRVREVKARFEALRLSAEFNTDQRFDKVRFEQARDLALLEAVAKALPPELRGKLTGSFRKITDLRTTKARGEYIQALIPKIETALEKHIAAQFRAAIRREMDRGAIKVSEARTRGGKIGAAGHAIFEQARKAMTFTPGEADVIAEKLTAQIEAAGEMTLERLEELDGMRAATELFADYENADSVRLEEALALLKGVYAEGRKEWLDTLMARRDLREQRVRPLRAGLGLVTVDDAGGQTPTYISRPDRARAKRQGEGTLDSLNETILAAMLSGSQKLRRLGELSDDPTVAALVEEMEQAFATAENVEADRNAADNIALAAALRDILGVSTEYGLAKRLRELSDGSKDAPVDTVEGFKEEDVKVPKTIIESILRREVSGFTDPKGNRVELDETDIAGLEKAWEQFQELDDDKQAARRTVTFTRRTAKGSRVGIGPVSMLEGLQLWLTMRQPDQATKLEAMGYDATTLSQLEAWLPAEVQQLGLWMVDHIGKDAFTVDTLHRQEKGVGLPLVENYFPVRNNVSRSDNTGAQLDGQPPQQSGRNVSFIKERVVNRAEPAIVNALAVFLAHRAQSNFWMSHVTAIREWGGVLKDESMADAIRVRMGEKYYASLQQLLRRIESGGSLAAGQVNDFERVIKRMMKSFALGTLGMRVSTLMVNTTAALNATFEVPAGVLLRGMMEVAKRPEAFRDAWNSPAIQRRIRDGATFEAALAKSSGPSKQPILALLDSLAEKGVAPINYIDTGANLIAAAAVWEHTRNAALRAGLDDAGARAAADRKVEVVLRRSAQPTGRIARSEIEQRALDNPLSALFALFISEPRKNFALTYMAARELITGKGTYGKQQAAQQLVVGLVMYAAAEFVVRNLFAAWAGAKDDEEEGVWQRFKARMTDPKAWAYKLATSHLTGVPVYGQGWAYGMAKLFDQPAFSSSPNPLFKSIDSLDNLATAFGKDDKDGNDPEAGDQFDAALKAASGLGSVLPGGALFAQTANVATFAEGVIETDAEKLARYKTRFRKFTAELPKAKDDKAIDAQNRLLRTDWIRGEIAPLTPERRKQVLEAIAPPEYILKELGD